MSVRIELRRDGGRIGPRSGPWIRRRQVAHVWGPPDPRALACVLDHRGETVAWGLYSPESDIVVRRLSLGPAPPEDDWLAVRIESALAARARLGLAAQPTDAYRLINSEGDRLPGLIVDRFASVHVVQLTTAPMLARRAEIEAALRAAGCTTIVVTVPAGAARHESIEAGTWGPPLDQLRFLEHGLTFSCPAPPTQKTGAYLDQRENRRIVAELAAGHGGPMLDLGCHVGGFAVHAAARGLTCVAVDQSETALDFVRRNAEPWPGRVSTVKADMFGVLADPALAGRFGTIVVDPPRLAATRRERERALGAMQALVGQLLPRVDEHGHFVLCSCSHHIGREDLDAVVTASAREPWVRTLALAPGPDHPIWPGHAEGEYLRVNAYQRR